MKKLKIFALVSFIVMCLSITFVSMSVGTATPTKASTIYMGGFDVCYETVQVGSHTVMIATYANDVEICRLD